MLRRIALERSTVRSRFDRSRFVWCAQAGLKTVRMLISLSPKKAKNSQIIHYGIEVILDAITLALHRAELNGQRVAALVVDELLRQWHLRLVVARLRLQLVLKGEYKQQNR